MKVKGEIAVRLRCPWLRQCSKHCAPRCPLVSPVSAALLAAPLVRQSCHEVLVRREGHLLAEVQLGLTAGRWGREVRVKIEALGIRT